MSEQLKYEPWVNPAFEGEEREPPEGEPEAAEAPPEREGPDPADFVPATTASGASWGEDFGEAETGVPPGEGGEPDFAAMKFLRENTLLSNAEKYAASIQEEAELYVDRIRKEVEQLNQEAEARYDEARQTKEQAEQEAEQLIAQAQEETDRIREEARAEGVAAGREEGMRQRYEEAGPYLERLEAILAELGNYRRQVAFYAEKDSIRLAVLMAKQVLRQELKLNRKAIWNLLARTLAKLEGQGQFRIWLNPQDYEFAKTARKSLEKYVDEDQSITFRAKPEVPAGNAQIETDREVIDLTFQNQFHYLEGVLNEALAERETLVTQRPASAAPPIPADDPPAEPEPGRRGPAPTAALATDEPAGTDEPHDEAPESE